MKKNYNSPEMISRRIFGSQPLHSRASRAYKTDGEDKEFDDVVAKLKEKLSQDLKGFATSAEIEAVRSSFISKNEFSVEAIRSLLDEKDGVLAKLAKQGIEIQRLNNEIKGNKEIVLSVRDTVKKWHENNAASISQFRAGNKSSLPEPIVVPLDAVRAAVTMLPSNIVTGAVQNIFGKVEVESGYVPYPRNMNLFWDVLTKGRTSSPTYGWVNRKPRDGAAAFIAPGIYKPKISFTFEPEISNAKKIADSAKCATELLDDVEGMASFIEQELTLAVYEKASVELLSGTESSTNPKGIINYANTYATTLGVKTKNPNNWDCIQACVTQIRKNKISGRVVAVINPVDATNMKLTKAVSQGQLYVPPATEAQVIENNEIPLGYVLVAAIDNYKVKIYKDLTVMWGLENDDFTKNMVTAIGEMRLHQYVSENHYTGFVYDTFSAIKAAITEA